MAQAHGKPLHNPRERDPPRPAYLVHAHAGISPIGQVNSFGFAPQVHAEPSSPPRVSGTMYCACALSPPAHAGTGRATGGSRSSHLSPPDHIPGCRTGAGDGPGWRGAAGSLVGASTATESLCADPVCSVHTPPAPRHRGPFIGAAAETKSTRCLNPRRCGGAGGVRSG